MSKELKKGEIIFNVGDNADAMYEVVSGKVGVFINYGEAAEKCLVEFPQGKIFGEMALLEKTTRSATVVALEKTIVEEIIEDVFDKYVAVNPEIAIFIMKNLSSRLRKVTNEYMEACQTLSEVVEADVPESSKKDGLWENIKKFAKVYTDAADYACGASSSAGRGTMPYLHTPGSTMLL